MESKQKYFISGIIISVIGALCFSSKAIFVKLGYRYSEADALSLLAVRMIGAAPFFAVSALYLLRNPVNRAKLSLKITSGIIATGCLGYYVASLLDFEGLNYVSAGLERLILFIYPTLVLMMGWLFFGRKITKTQWLAVLISYTGIILAVAGEFNLANEFRPANQSSVAAGMLLITGCAISYAAYITGSSLIIPAVGASLFNSLAMLAASAGVLIHFIFAGTQDLSDLSRDAWTFGLLMAVFATVIPSYLIAESIRRIGGENTAIIASVGPVATILMAWWWLGEAVTIWQLAGTLCTLTGVWLISRK